MRVLKLVGIVALALVALVVIGAVALIAFVDPNDYRDDIARIVEEKTGRPLTIGGEIDLKVFPRLALRIEGVSLGNPPGFGEQPFLEVRSASVGVRLLPLLQQRLEVSRVAVDGLTVTLISRGEEDNNWKDLAQSDEQASAGGDAATTTTIAGVDIRDSTLIYRDEAEDSTMRLTGLEVHTGPLGGSDPVDAQAEFNFDQGEAQPLAHLKINTQLLLPAEASVLELRDLSVEGEWLGEQPLPLSVKAPAVVLDLDAETLKTVTFDIKFGELPLQLTATGEKLFSDMVVTGQINVPQVSPRKVMASLKMEVPKTSDANVLTRFTLKSNYQLTQTRAALSDLALALDDTRVNGSFAIDDLEAMAMAFDLTVDSINVDRYLEPESDSGATTQATGSGQTGGEEQSEPVELPIEMLRELNAKGLLRVGKAQLSGLQFSDVRLPLSAKGGNVRLGPTAAKLFDGSYEGDIVLDARPAKARLSLNEHVKNIDLGALAKAAFDSTRLVGRGNANAVLTGQGNTDQEILRTLSGKVDTDVKDGAFVGVDLWYELRRAWAVIKQQPLPVRAEGAPRTEFKTLSASAVLNNGVLKNDDLRIDLDYLKATGKGTLDMSTQAVDYRLVAEVYKLPAEGAGAEMAELKAAEIPISITGTLADMKVRPDVQSIVKERVRKEVTEKVQETKDELKKKLEDRLKGLFNR